MPKKSAATHTPPAAQAGNQPGQPDDVAQATPSTPIPPSPQDAPPAGVDASGAAPEMATAEFPPLPQAGEGRGEGVFTLTITAKREGFRRAGRAWSVAPTTVDAHDFTQEQLEQLAREDSKMLTITGP